MTIDPELKTQSDHADKQKVSRCSCDPNRMIHWPLPIS